MKFVAPSMSLMSFLPVSFDPHTHPAYAMFPGAVW